MPGRPRRRLLAADALIERVARLRRDIAALATPAALARDLDLKRVDRMTRHWAEAAQASEELLYATLRVRGELWVRLREARRRQGLRQSAKSCPNPPPARAAGPSDNPPGGL